MLEPAAIAALLLLAAALVVVAAVPTPAMVDYVNHLARMEILTTAADHPAYVSDLRFGTNRAMDIIVPTLGRWLGASAADRLLLACSLALIVTGSMALEQVVKGRRDFAGLCAAAMLFSLPVTWGLGNFTLGLGVALWAAAAWAATRSSSGARLWLIHLGSSFALFTIHLFALGLYGLIIGSIELSAWLSGSLGLVALLKRFAGMAIGPGAMVVLMVLTGSRLGVPEPPAWNLLLKALWFLQVMTPYSLVVSSASALAAAGLLVFLVLTRRIRMRGPGQVLGGLLALLYLTLPVTLFGIAYLDVRLLTFAGLGLPAFIEAAPGRWRPWAAALLIGIALSSGGVAAWTWSERQADYADFRVSFSGLQRGEAVLVALADDQRRDDQPLIYAPTLAAPEAGVFVSSLYGPATGAPIRVTGAFQHLEVRRPLDYLPPRLSALLRGEVPPQHRNWRQDFVHLYVVGPRPASTPPGLVPEYSGRRFTLYRIKKAPTIQ
jgi:hypothetical protein